jgi:hypothetical protein
MTKPAQRPLVVLALACASMFASGCALFGGQTGQESNDSVGGAQPCGSGRAGIDSGLGDIDAGVDDANPDDIVGALRGPYTAPFEWNRRQTETQITIALLDHDASAARRTVDGECHHRLEIPVTVSIAAGDGLLDEQAVTTLSASARATGELQFTIPLRDLAGTYDGSEVEDTDPSRAELTFDIQLSAGKTSGTVELGTTSVKAGSGSRTRDLVGTWPALH